eukprot:4316871-Amphidinium_carterae.1
MHWSWDSLVLRAGDDHRAFRWGDMPIVCARSVEALLFPGQHVAQKCRSSQDLHSPTLHHNLAGQSHVAQVPLTSSVSKSHFVVRPYLIELALGLLGNAEN